MQLKLVNRTKINRATLKRRQKPMGTEVVEPVVFKKNPDLKSSSNEDALRLVKMGEDENSEDSVKIEKLENGIHKNKKYRHADDEVQVDIVNPRTGRIVNPVRVVDDLKLRTIIADTRMEEEQFRAQIRKS